MQGLRTHIEKREEALRYLRERGKYVYDRPVQRRSVRTPILTKHVMDMHEQRRR